VTSYRGLKERLEEIGCYPDLLDVLISPSNMRNFADAISGELVSIPAMIQRKIQEIHEGSLTYLKNMADLEAALSVKREETLRWEEQAKKDFGQLASLLGLDLGRFDCGASELELIKGEMSQKLEEIPRQLESIAKISGRLETEEIDHKLQAVMKAEAVLPQRESVISMAKELVNARKIEKLLTTWSGSFKQLPPASRPQDLQSFSIPSIPPRLKSALPKNALMLSERINEAKRKMSYATRICSKYRIPMELVDLKNRIKSYRELLSALKHPSAEIRGVEAIVFRENGKAIVSIPLDKAVEDPSVFTELESVPRVHRPAKWGKVDFKQKVKKCVEQVEQFILELDHAKKSISVAKQKLSEAKKLIGLLESDKSSFSSKVNRIEGSIQKSLGELGRACGGLQIFGVELPEMKEGLEFINDGYDALASGLKEARGLLKNGAKKLLQEFPELAGEIGKIGPGAIRDLMFSLDQKRKELSNQSESCRQLVKWIELNLEAKRRNDSMAGTIELLSLALGVAKEILSKLAEETEAYSSIFAEPGFKFTHLGEGRFISSVDSVPITHPGGSEKAVMSIGIMATIARCFDFPVILDEALDRIDVDKVAPLLDYATGLSAHNQLCLVVCKSFNIEKNPALLQILSNWRIHKVSRKGRKKFVELVEPNSIIQYAM
jgi:hypothetical protein